MSVWHRYLRLTGEFTITTVTNHTATSAGWRSPLGASWFDFHASHFLMHFSPEYAGIPNKEWPECQRNRPDETAWA